uniref:Limiting CO2-inducible protein B/C beta carbonyic anhydrase domain-containing protein n=1 Tax=Eucampia antarctica TaxID=49252 RepID=A0A7S2RWZ3_9STRA|mmetsp:Transcript_27972/g.26826  ORF Transcript_27972/g.26826 Transcript_27972/m.26826 type:complete len:334 (+) Transcript_27972:213-1214(+)|eukprot:CAMPEP_0197825424 /NCGR_PEP_ID=MMETSP1437-20131217/2499_1 /TAXON_ID=49252 ORGANISM="Eucampia antarctica, Strain CCMP1452" /NCGR_SAMPLE_ID=MMETSP1437 /ASSEMBLY_ACC=CAM_ASM_001096 /LENGTH=333 /DNA_ID=CAMNT_0043425417 /DNA_START=169 /DNA_END=1170 /DNA_ORIENTATION=+
MLFRNSVLLLCASSAIAFQPMAFAPSRNAVARPSTSLNIVVDKTGVLEKIKQIIVAEDYPAENAKFDALVKSTFPGAMSNKDLETKVVEILAKKGFEGENTLLATSLCCDELARRLEDDLGKVYGKNFFLGGLAGFPFAGNTGFGAMSAHIPDNGNCLIVQAPHVGITQDGLVGKVEREGIALVDSCCGSAIAASNYLSGITEGGATLTTKIQNFSDFQQGAVQELILPHGKRLTDAGNDRMIELPYALYESQDMLMQDIIVAGKGGLKKGTAVLSGIQINTSPDSLDYFHPLRFDFLDSNGDVVEDLLPVLTGEDSKVVDETEEVSEDADEE